MITVLVIALVGCIAPSLTAAQQSGCGIPSSNAQVASLIAGNYATPQGTTLPTIVLQTSPQWSTLSYRILCLSTSGIRDQYRFVSIVAYYTKDGQGPEYGQYEFECVQSQWSSSSTLLDASQFNRQIRTASSPAINATLRTDCSYCLAPTLSLSYRTSDAINHCNPCAGCNPLPQQLCYSEDSNIPPTTQCCNVYLADGSCAIQCPSSSPPSFTDANRTCVPCLLTCQNGGALKSNSCACNCSRSGIYGGTNCTACMCNNGGTCSGSSCTCPPGYTGVLCETSCPTSCPSGYYLNNCNCVQCLLSCQNGGVLQNDTCGCNCSKGGVYGGTDCTTCMCRNGGRCNGSVCACSPGYTGVLCEAPCPTSCPAGYYQSNCSCVLCPLSCQNGGVLRNDTCACSCKSNSVYGGTDCTACLCMNGGRCNGSACACPPSFVGTLCGAACTISCPQGYVLNPYGCGCDREPACTGPSCSSCGVVCAGAIIGSIFGILILIIILVVVVIGLYYVLCKHRHADYTDGKNDVQLLFMEENEIEEKVTNEK